MQNQKISLSQMAADLGLDQPFVRGVDIPIKNCWHFSTDGNAVDVIFYDEQDFMDGMNRIYVILQDYGIIILAFCLMDNHVHFILYGSFEECNRFMHEFIRRTSMAITERHGDSHKLAGVPINCQTIDTDSYLKTVICYVLKNPCAAGLPYTWYDYPWSSGSLYFRQKDSWTSPVWELSTTMSRMHIGKIHDIGLNGIKKELKTRNVPVCDARIIDGIVFPGEYIPVQMVEMIYRSHKSFMYFVSHNKESDVETRGGVVAPLSIPDQEMRQHKAEICLEMFGTAKSKDLAVDQRLRLAKTLRRKYSCSPKQVARVCGLVYSEVEKLL